MNEVNPLNAIETKNLRKEYGDKVAVADLSLSIGRGEVFGFLGPNGAGKTTSVKMLLGLVAPTAGEGWMLGRPLGDPRSRFKVGFLPEHFRFHDWLTAREFLKLHADLYMMPTNITFKRIDELLELVDLSPFANQRLRTFSKGMLQRVGLAQALLNEPDLVILDEPTSGLDPVGRLLVRDIIHRLREKGATVFLNSHLLSEVEITCDRVAFIKHGTVIQTHSLVDLVETSLSLEVRARPLAPDVVAGIGQWGRQIRQDGERVTMTLTDEEQIPVINHYLLEHGAEVYALFPHKISLEDLFIQVIGTDGGL